MTRKTVWRAGAAALVLVIALAGFGLWWVMQQPMYQPGALARMHVADPVGVSVESGGAAGETDGARLEVSFGQWEVEPGVELAYFSVGERSTRSMTRSSAYSCLLG